jgi:hypothetical protein
LWWWSQAGVQEEVESLEHSAVAHVVRPEDHGAGIGIEPQLPESAESLDGDRPIRIMPCARWTRDGAIDEDRQADPEESKTLAAQGFSGGSGGPSRALTATLVLGR